MAKSQPSGTRDNLQTIFQEPVPVFSGDDLPVRGQKETLLPNRLSWFRGPNLFILSVLLLTAAALWPIWAFRLLPLQDYPQHLFLSQVVATYDNPAFDWHNHYQVDLGFRPYMLWYLVMKGLAPFSDVETAGKTVFSIYILLITALAFASGRNCPKDSSPWGALLLFPFAFHQMYFMGFSNYILSLPILFLAVLDLEKLAEGASFWTVTRQILYLGILFLNHPYAVLVYIGLASAVSLSALGKWKVIGRTLAPAIVACIVFTAWFAAQHGPSSVPTSVAEPDMLNISWWPFMDRIKYYLLMFTGMRWTENPDWLVAGPWVCIAVVFCISWSQNHKHNERLRWPLYMFSASLFGFLVLPFWFGYYSYFNLRLAPVSYFALSLALSRKKIGPRAGLAVAACATLLVVFSIRTQAKVSQEAEQVLPVVAKIQKNSLVLPLIFDGSSSTLDPKYFYQIHSHEAHYYHVVVGGGATPDLFPNAMMPVQYRPGFSLYTPGNPSHFLAFGQDCNYDYILSRKLPPESGRRMAPYFDLVAKSGHWELFSRKPLQTNPSVHNTANAFAIYGNAAFR